MSWEGKEVLSLILKQEEKPNASKFIPLVKTIKRTACPLYLLGEAAETGVNPILLNIRFYSY